MMSFADGRAIDLAAAGRVGLTTMVTHTFTLEE